MMEREQILSFRRPDETSREVAATRLAEGDAEVIGVQIRLGAARWSSAVSDLPGPGAILVLDRAVEDPVEIVVAGQTIGFGRLVVSRNKLAIEICQLRRGGRKKAA